MTKVEKKQFCRYVVLEYATGKELIRGEKLKDCSGLYDSGSFLSFFRVVREYRRFVITRGVTCLIVYWANARRKKGKALGSRVSPYGLSLGFRGISRSDTDHVYPELVTEGI